jgi:hypothetical protein
MATLLLVMAVGALAVGATTVVGNASLLNAYETRRTEMEALADAGLEIARVRLNADTATFPSSGYRAIENGVVPVDASGAAIAGARRWTYAGPVGQTTGQYGVFGSVISIVQIGSARVIRRRDLIQESFAKFAYFTDVEPSTIAFGNNDQISGPVHSNDTLRIYASRATFRGPGTVTTARMIAGKAYGTFAEGYRESAARIPMPSRADLARLRTLAAEGNAAFSTAAGGAAGQSRLRIEFLTIDLNGDGLHTGEDEGFFRVYETSTAAFHWTTASIPPSGGWAASPNCGYWETPIRFVRLAEIPAIDRPARFRDPNSKCYLGGSDSLWNGFVESDGNGAWLRRPFALATTPPALAARADREFLFPLGRGLNPEFRGVIHVNGKVAVSGVLRGRVTLAADDRILIADDVTYASQGEGGCQDMLGFFGGSDVVVLDNALNTPQRNTTSDAYRSYDSTPDEFIQGVILTLNTFNVENHSGGPNGAERCGTTSNGRGCLFLTGGIIQRTRGAVGTTGGTGYVKRYAYDACAATNPPPYFPTTGHFDRSRYYEVDPVGFDVSDFFDRMSRG